MMEPLYLLDVQQVPGFQVLQLVASYILGTAALVHSVASLARMCSGQPANLVAPVVNLSLCALLLPHMQEMANWLADMAILIANAMEERSNEELFGRAVAMALGNMACDANGFMATVALFLTWKGWLAMLSGLLLIAIYIVKILILDVVWVILFGLVLLLGQLNVPLSMLPGMGGMGSWIKNLLGIGLIPVMFQMLVSVLSLQFPSILEAVAGGSATLNCGTPELAQKLTERVYAGNALPGSNDPFEAVWLWLQFIAICAAYFLLLFLTPVLSFMLVYSAPMTMLAGAIMAKAMGSMGKLNAGINKALGVPSGAAASASGGSGGGGGPAGYLMPRQLKSAEQTLDQRK